MSVLDVLRDEYPGDDAWRKFVDVFRSDWTRREDKEFYISKFGDEEIAIVLSASLGLDAINWSDRPIGALGKRAPINVLTSDPSGTRIIRTLLMRMPR